LATPTRFRKIVVSQRFLPHYRVPLFERAVESLRAEGYDLRLYYSFHLGKVGEYQWATRLLAIKKTVQLGEITESAVWAPSLFFRLLLTRPSIVVVEDLAGLPNGLMAAIYCRLFRKPYLIWGLGNIPGKVRSRLRGLLDPVIKFFYSGAAGFICYSSHAQRVYGQTGKPTFLAPNACLPRPSADQQTSVLGFIRKKYFDSKCRIVTVGELKYQKRFDVLLHSVAQLKAFDLEVQIIGDGPERANLERLADELQIGGIVRFCGAIYELPAKEKIFSQAALGVLPGRGGLVIQELMFYGIPVICGKADGTEADLIVEGQSGRILADATDSAQLTMAIEAFFKSTTEEKKQMATAAHETIANGWHIEEMTDAFCKAIVSTEHASLESSLFGGHY
jgi:glycosyltransferase involved in cell wall biosynthesis